MAWFFFFYGCCRSKLGQFEIANILGIMGNDSILYYSHLFTTVLHTPCQAVFWGAINGSHDSVCSIPANLGWAAKSGAQTTDSAAIEVNRAINFQYIGGYFMTISYLCNDKYILMQFDECVWLSDTCPILPTTLWRFPCRIIFGYPKSSSGKCQH